MDSGGFYLDDGAMTHLLTFLDAQSLCKASMTCRTWNQLASDDFLWRALHLKNPHPMVNRSELPPAPSPCSGAGGRETGGRGRGSDHTPCSWTEGSRERQGAYFGASLPLPLNSSCSSSSSHSLDACFSDKRMRGHGSSLGEGSSSPASSAASVASPQCLSYKESYATGANWRKGRGRRVIASFPGSNWNSAARLHLDGDHCVLASAGMGSVNVVHASTGLKCPQFVGISSQHLDVETGIGGDALDALYSSVAISRSCRQVAFGGFDGTVSLFDITRGSLLASATVPALRPAVTALGFCSIQSTQVIASGLADGRVALSPLQAWDVCLGSPACNQHAGSCNLIGCHGLKPEAWTSEPRQVSGPWITCNLGTGVEVRRIKGECGAGAGLAIVAGTSGGHVMVVDGAAGRVRSALVGSCNCPVKCLSLHKNGEGPPIPDSVGSAQLQAAAVPAPQELSRVVYAGFDHAMVGNGHYNAIYVWDVNSSERVALLHPGSSALRGHRGGRGVCCRRQSMYDMGSMVRSVWADGWKVAVSSGKAVTVFETRTWKPLYELSIPSPPAGTPSAPSNNSSASVEGPSVNVPPPSEVAKVDKPPVLVEKGGLDSGSFCEDPAQLKSEMLGVEPGAPDPTCASGGGCMSLSPEKHKSAADKAKMLEEVSESPGSLIFFGNTLALGLKDNRYALVQFCDRSGLPGVEAEDVIVKML